MPLFPLWLRGSVGADLRVRPDCGAGFPTCTCGIAASIVVQASKPARFMWHSRPRLCTSLCGTAALGRVPPKAEILVALITQPMPTKTPQKPKSLIDADPWLKPFADRLAHRDS